MNKENSPLHNRDEFFKLPIEGSFDPGLSPIESGDQPTGFFDDSNNVWIPVYADDGTLKRQLL